MQAFSLTDWHVITSDGSSREKLADFLTKRDVASCSQEVLVPAIPEMPAALRRRATSLTRYVARVFYDIVPPELFSSVRIVFLSEEGEVMVLQELLESLAIKELLSPMAFCNSVHHTPTGYLSIATKNRGVARTISGGEEGFYAGLLEVAMLMQESAQPVVLIVADERVPEALGDTEGALGEYAVAFLFRQRMADCNDYFIIDRTFFKEQKTSFSLMDFCRLMEQ